MKRAGLVLLMLLGLLPLMAVVAVGGACLAAVLMWNDIVDTAKTGRVPWA
jgi:hypothetical protein